MSDFAKGSMIQRRQILEDVLADVLRSVGEITSNQNLERCIAIQSPYDPKDWQMTPLYDLACQMEAKLA